MRARGEPLEIPEIDEDAARGRRHARAPARGCARCRRGAGGRNNPASASASIAPLPARVGTSETTDAPLANATSSERRSQSSCSRDRHERRRDRAETRARRCRDSRARPAARRKPSTVNRLFRRSSASGCAVSSPIATSSVAWRSASRHAAAKRVEQPIHAAAPSLTSTGCDSTMTCAEAGERGRDGVVVGVGYRARIEEAAGVVQLHAARSAVRGFGFGVARAAICAGSRRAACPRPSCSARDRTSRSATDIRGR